MNPIEELLAEHDAVLSALEILRRIAEQLENTGTIPSPVPLAQLLDFFSQFVDQCHHGKEEELLFPALEAVGVSRHGGPIGAMLNEHQQGRDHVSGMKNALNAYSGGNNAALRDLIAHARAYISLLQDHIEKENQVLFPIAARHLSAATMNALKTGFDQIETQRIGAGKHEAFHRMLAELQNV